MLEREEGISTSVVFKQEMGILASKSLTVRTKSGMQDPRLVSGNIYDAGKGGIFPNSQLIVRYAVAGDKLAVTKRANISLIYCEDSGGQNVLFTPLQTGDLATSVDRVDAGSSGGVPKVDTTIMVATTSSDEIGLPRAPRESLDGCFVVSLGPFRSGQQSRVPNVDEIIITTTSKLGAISTPLKTAKLGSVTIELGNFVVSDADIMVKYVTGPGAGGKDGLVPRHDTHTGFMTPHSADLGLVLDIPKLDITVPGSNGDEPTIIRPLDRTDISIRSRFHKCQR